MKMKFPIDIYKARKIYREVRTNPETARFLNEDRKRMSLFQQLFIHGKVINHGYYMPLFSTLFPTKFRTLGHKKAVLKPK